MFNNSPDSVATVNLIDIIVLLKLFSNRITILHSSLKSKLKSVKSGVDDPNKLNSRKKPKKKISLIKKKFRTYRIRIRKKDQCSIP